MDENKVMHGKIGTETPNTKVLKGLLDICFYSNLSSCRNILQAKSYGNGKNIYFIIFCFVRFWSRKKAVKKEERKDRLCFVPLFTISYKTFTYIHPSNMYEGLECFKLKVRNKKG